MDHNGIRMDIAPAYGLEHDSVIRDIRFDRASSKVTIEDSFKFTDNQNHIIERFVSRSEPKETERGIIIGTESESMTMSLIEGSATVKIYSETINNHNGVPYTAWFIDFVSDSSEKDLTLKFEIK